MPKFRTSPIAKASIVTAILLSACLLRGSACAEDLPACLKAEGHATIEQALKHSGVSEEEALTRLVYAEGISTGCGDEAAVYEAIAWGVMNRVRLGEACPPAQATCGRGIMGVLFKQGQFNPAVSGKSPFSKEFLCPSSISRWYRAGKAARQALSRRGNPFIQTPWEKEHGLSLVVNFYYPESIQAKAPLAPWENSPALQYIGNFRIGDTLLSAQKIRFYRLTAPPRACAREKRITGGGSGF